MNVNELMNDFGVDIGSAGASFPRIQRFYVRSIRDPIHSRHAGSPAATCFVLGERRAAAELRLLTRRVAAGRPTIVARAVDSGAGVDPLSLVISYRGVLVGAALYDPISGIAVFPLPSQATAIKNGRTRAVLSASDFQEAKNVNTVGDDVLPNTAFRTVRSPRSPGRHSTWVTPAANACVGKTAGFVVAASSTKRITAVRFFVDGKRVARRPARRRRALLRVVADAPRGGRDGTRSGPWRPTAADDRRRNAHVRVCR